MDDLSTPIDDQPNSDDQSIKLWAGGVFRDSLKGTELLWRWLFAALFDSLIFILWILIQYSIQKIAGWIPLDGLDALNKTIIENVLGVTTTIPIVLYVIYDTIKLVKQTIGLIRTILNDD